MLVTLLGMTTLPRPEHAWKAPAPRVVILFGIEMAVSVDLFAKAKLPILVTGRPLVVAGMVTAPPLPVYPVIVIAPELVV